MKIFTSYFVIFLLVLIFIIVCVYLRSLNKDKSLEDRILEEINAKRYEKSLRLLNANKKSLSKDFFYNEIILVLSRIEDFNSAYKMVLESLDVLNKDSIPYQLYNNISFVYYNLSLYNKSIEFADKALMINKKDEFAFANKGFSFIKLGNLKDAEECFNEALSLNSDFPNAISGKAHCAYENKNYLEAAFFIEKFIKFEKNEYTSYKKLGECYFHLNKFKKSIEMYEKAISINPNCSICYCEYSNVLCYLGDIESANKAIDRALSFDPFNPITLYYKCRICALNRNSDEAFYYLERAILEYSGFKQIALNDSALNNLKVFSKFNDLTEENS